MSHLKSAYEIALDRFGAESPIEAAVLVRKEHPREDNSILIDPEAKTESPYADFFVDHLPREDVGSRAVPLEEKKMARHSERLKKVKNLDVVFEGPMLT